MNNIDEILERLQSAEQPVIDNTEEMMERIMRGIDSQNPLSVPVQPVRTGSRGEYSLLILRTVLSLAALWIIGFFIYLQYDIVVPVESNTSSQGGAEGSSTLKEVYKDRLCQDCKKTISYTQIRSMLYENK